METKIETIDTHHKQLFRYGRDIEQLIKTGCVGVTEQQLVDIICHLREYVSYNTYEEEKIMGEMNYKKIEEHKRAHVEFTQKIMEISSPDLKKEPLKNLKVIKDIMVSYVFSHILTENIDMGKAYMTYQKKKEKNETKEIKQEKVKERTEEEKEKEELFGYKICNLDVTEVYLYKNQTREGEMVAVYKGKLKKLNKLNALERSSYFSDIDRIGKIMDKVYEPEAINYMFMEDIEGQLNFHMIPKRKEDKDWGKPIILSKNEDTLKKEEYEERINMLKELLPY